MTGVQEKTVIAFFNCAGISVVDISELHGTIVDRDDLLTDEKYNKIKELIPVLKTMYSSSYMTSLQKTAGDTQKWPVINIVRQLLKSYGYDLVPKRCSNGYTKSGKKIYKRTFVITSKKLKPFLNNIDTQPNHHQS